MPCLPSQTCILIRSGELQSCSESDKNLLPHSMAVEELDGVSRRVRFAFKCHERLDVHFWVVRSLDGKVHQKHRLFFVCVCGGGGVLQKMGCISARIGSPPRFASVWWVYHS